MSSPTVSRPPSPSFGKFSPTTRSSIVPRSTRGRTSSFAGRLKKRGGRIMTALWTEVCLAFPTLDAIREGYEVFPVVDAVGGTSPEAHRAGLERIVQAGAQPISWVSLACELQRDWARVETVPDVVDIVLTSRLYKGL